MRERERERENRARYEGDGKVGEGAEGGRADDANERN